MKLRHTNIKNELQHKNQLPTLAISVCNQVTWQHGGFFQESQPGTTCVLFHGWCGHAACWERAAQCAASCAYHLERKSNTFVSGVFSQMIKQRTPHGKKWNMSCLDLGYSYSFPWNNNSYYWEIHFRTSSLQVMEKHVMLLHKFSTEHAPLQIISSYITQKTQKLRFNASAKHCF